MSDMLDVLIVGGGAAGIAAARRLAGLPLAVRLVEAGDRLGGRARTDMLAGMPLDLGCYWLHSADRNAWARLARETGAAVDQTPPAWQQQWQDIGFSRAEQAEACAAFDAFDRKLREETPASDVAGDALDPACRWNPWLDALSGFINGAELARLSARDYLAYEDADTGVNHRLPSGYGAFICAAMPDVPVMLGTKVLEIDRSGPVLAAVTERGRIMARTIIVAVSTEMLAHERLRFTPALPAKVEAASRLPLGLANKAFLLLDRLEPFEPDTQLIGDPRRADSGSYYLRPFGRSLIECFFGGAGARSLEAAGEGAACDFAIEQLVGLLGSSMRKRLTPLVETRWAAEPHVGGAYSHALPGHADARIELARPVEDRIFFAGEACSVSDFSTAHGAHDNGVAAAEAALRALGLVRA
jgi:monoamine oxidase